MFNNVLFVSTIANIFAVSSNNIIVLFLWSLKESKFIAADTAVGYAIALLFVLCNPWAASYGSTGVIVHGREEATSNDSPSMVNKDFCWKSIYYHVLSYTAIYSMKTFIPFSELFCSHFYE